MLGSSHSSWWRHTINKHEEKEMSPFPPTWKRRHLTKDLKETREPSMNLSGAGEEHLK